jgi:N-carbamoylputrescine amidase
MSVITIALLQMTACGNDQAANLAKGEAFCRQAQALGADIALFPEMWNIGYTPFNPITDDASAVWRAPELWERAETGEAPALPQARTRWQAQAVGPDDPFATHFRGLARELKLAIALTYLERWPGAPRNTLSLIDRHGQIKLTYAKVHTCDFDLLESVCTPGDDFYVCSLDTAQGEVNIGAMICYDREFPESARILMLKGAEIILTPNACELEQHRLGQFKARAFENMVGLAMTNYASPQQNGHSIACDPVAFDQSGSRDTVLVEAGPEEGIYLAKFDLDRIRAWRQREVWGNAFRRPHRYTILTESHVEPPFVRVNFTGEKHHQTRR